MIPKGHKRNLETDTAVIGRSPNGTWSLLIDGQPVQAQREELQGKAT